MGRFTQLPDNLDGAPSTRPRNLRQFWKENPQIKLDDLEKDFRWKLQQSYWFSRD